MVINAPCYGNEVLTSPKANGFWYKQIKSIDSLLKTIRFSIHLVVYNKELAIPEQTATGKGTLNLLMAGSLPKTTEPTLERSILNWDLKFIKKVKGDILLVQVYVDDIIFGSTKKSLCIEFEKLMHKKFQMSSMSELTFFLGLHMIQKDDGIFISQDKYVDEILKKFSFSIMKTTSTPMETLKPLMKDENAEDVNVYLYRSMISSLMYLTSSRPDIIDYDGASLDRKSTTRGCQFLRRRMISWQCKKKTVVANSTTEAEWLEWSAKAVKGEIEVKTEIQLLRFMKGSKFVDSHNMVAYLEKSTEHAVFDEIVDFLNASPIRYALTVSPTIYVSYIEQFWSTTKIKIVNNERQIHDKVDGKTIVISESSMRKDLQFNDEDGSGPRHQDTILADRLAQTRVLALENVKTAQDLEITSLKKREDASKQGRNIAESDQDEEILVIQEDAETQGRYDQDIDVTTVSAPITTAGVSVSTAEPSTPLTTTTVIDDEDLTIAPTLMKMRSEKSKEKAKERGSKAKERGSKEKSSEPVTRPTRGVTMQEPSESGIRKVVPPLQHDLKDKGKAKIIKLEKPIKKNDQIKFDEEVAKRLTKELEAELEEEERLTIQREEEANLISWDNTQAMMEAYYELAQRLQEEDQGELTIKERSRLFVELMDKKKKHFTKLRAKKIRRKPPSKA
ncbi:putative ribonuclease H-like domain-containing protein [Tanacetum coccineum]